MQTTYTSVLLLKAPSTVSLGGGVYHVSKIENQPNGYRKLFTEDNLTFTLSPTLQVMVWG